MSRNFSTAAPVAMLLVSVAACGVHARDKQQYAGTLSAQSPGCPAMRATLVVREGRAVFSPGDSTWILTGTATATHVEASESRPSFDHKTYATTLDADLNEAAVHGIYQTPFCRYAVALDRF